MLAGETAIKGRGPGHSYSSMLVRTVFSCGSGGRVYPLSMGVCVTTFIGLLMGGLVMNAIICFNGPEAVGGVINYDRPIGGFCH